MFSSTYPTLAEVLRQVRKEQPRQFAVVFDKGEEEWQYSRSSKFVSVV